MTRKDILARYRHLRAIAMRHNSAALGFVSRQVVLENAKRLGLAEGRMLVAGSEEEMTLVFDLALHAAKEARSRALDRYARATPLPPGSDEVHMLDAMRHARFSIWRIERRHEAVGLSSNLLIVTHLASPFAVEFDDRVLDGKFEVFDGWKGAVGEEVALEITPGPLDVVQLGRVFRQPLDGQPGSCGDRRMGEPAGMDRAVVEHQHDRHDRPPRFRSVAMVKLFQQSDEVGAAFAGADMHDQFAAATVEHAEQRPLARLARRRDAQVGAPFGPSVRQIRMRQRLRFVAEQQDDVASNRLLAQQTQPQSRPVDRLRILSAVQAMAGAAPFEPPFFSALLNCAFEIESPLRAASSACNRGKVQFGRSATGLDRTSRAKARAASLLIGAGPACGCARKPSTPSAMNHVRHRRTLSGVTPKARAICPLVQPCTDNKTARARSTSSRRADRASASSSATSSTVATTRGRPTMTPSILSHAHLNTYQMWRGQENPA